MANQEQGWEMHITEMDLFTGLNLDIMREIADTCCTEEAYPAGTMLFQEGDAAKHLYILVEGAVELKIKGDTTVFSLSTQSDIFGWSSLVYQAQYTATALCQKDIKAVKIDTTRLNRVFDLHPEFGLAVYRRLSGVFNQRLSSIYHHFLSVK